MEKSYAGGGDKLRVEIHSMRGILTELCFHHLDLMKIAAEFYSDCVVVWASKFGS
jgi:hypothetical protein